jgi:hypothetical protein
MDAFKVQYQQEVKGKMEQMIHREIAEKQGSKDKQVVL